MRYFTPEEANAALAEVRPLVERMVAHRRTHAAALEAQEELEGRIRGNGGGIPPAQLADAAAVVEREARALAWCAGAIVGIYVLSGIVSLIPLPQSPGNEQGLTPKRWEPAHATAYVVNAIVICTWVPFVEELTYRGLGYSLLERLGRGWAIFAVGLLFGLAHGLVLSLPVIVAFGCALAWVRAETDSVLPGMVAHALFNAVALVAAVTIGS